MHMLNDGVYWTGYVDWDLRTFHGYSTPEGSTYNAYLILDEQPTLIDTVKYYGFDEMLARIREVIDPAKIRYIVSNHTEMDHSGSIGMLLRHCPNAQVVCSPKGHEGLFKHFQADWPFKVVQNGERLSIGKRELTFVHMPMVHWPDSMATWSPVDGTLFSNDAFGQHRACPQRYADEYGIESICEDAAKYYANIVLPYGAQVLKVLDAVSQLPLKAICPSHGLIWRRPQDIELISGLYRKWASHETDPQVLIVYDTMWHSTEIMAKRLYAALDEVGIPVTLQNLQASHISDVVARILSSRVVAFGTPILNNRMLPTVSALLMYLKGLKPKNRHALTFGSYGWSTAGFKEFEQSLSDAGFVLAGEGVYSNYIPDRSVLERLDSLVPAVRGVL
jgi:flavorubredoxin